MMGQDHRNDPPCQRKRRGIQDELFLDGDLLCFHDEALFCWDDDNDNVNQDGNINNNSDDMMDAENEAFHRAMDGNDHPTNDNDDDNANYSFAYKSKHHPGPFHRHAHETEGPITVCAVCNLGFPNERLLDLHIAEAHDAYFQESLKAGVTTLPCLEPSCHQVFASAQERRVHLMKVHGYPKWFRFIPSQWLEVSEKTRKKRKWLKQRALHATASDITMTQKAESTTVPCTDNERILPNGRKDKREERRRKQMEKRANKPCRYFLSDAGCWRGDKCMFLHERMPFEPTHASTNTNSMDIDSGVANTGMSTGRTNTNRRVPDKLSFGRRRR